MNASLAKVVVVVSSHSDGTMPSSDRAAVGQVLTRFVGNVSVHSPTADLVGVQYALAAGAAEIVTLEGGNADLIVFGQGGMEPWGELLPARTALQCGAHLVLDVLEFESHASELVVTRDLGEGAQEILTLPFPIVVVMSSAAKSSLYVSRFRQLKVANQARHGLASITTSLERDVAPQPRWETTRPRTRHGDLTKKTTGDAQSRMFNAFGLSEATSSDASEQHIIQGDAKHCASHLLRYLAHHGLIQIGYEPELLAADEREGVPSSPAGLSIDRPERRPIAANFGYATSLRTSANSRSPRPLRGALPGVLRRPRPYPVASPESEKLSRRPRPLGQPVPHHLRGPFPVTHAKP